MGEKDKGMDSRESVIKDDDIPNNILLQHDIMTLDFFIQHPFSHRLFCIFHHVSPLNPAKQRKTSQRGAESAGCAFLRGGFAAFEPRERLLLRRTHLVTGTTVRREGRERREGGGKNMEKYRKIWKNMEKYGKVG